MLKKRFSPSSDGAFSRMQKNMAILKSQKADRGLTLADIPPQLQRLFVASNGKILLQVYGKQDLWERGPDESFTKDVLSVAPNATGTPILNYYATELMRISYVQAAGWALFSPSSCSSSRISRASSTSCSPSRRWCWPSSGAPARWSGSASNSIRRTSSRCPLIIGVDVAFGVYIIDRYREGRKAQHLRRQHGQGDHHVVAHLALRLQLAARPRILPACGDIGQLMSLGIAIGLVTAIFILPQILALLKPTAPKT